MLKNRLLEVKSIFYTQRRVLSSPRLYMFKFHIPANSNYYYYHHHHKLNLRRLQVFLFPPLPLFTIMIIMIKYFFFFFFTASSLCKTFKRFTSNAAQERTGCFFQFSGKERIGDCAATTGQVAIRKRFYFHYLVQTRSDQFG